MRAGGVAVSIATYSTLALAFAKKGDVEQVERLRELLDADQIPLNEYFVCAQLEVYGSCRPRLPQRAEEVFREGIASGLTANWHMAKSAWAGFGDARGGDLAGAWLRFLGLGATQHGSSIDLGRRGAVHFCYCEYASSPDV